jgi:hypothetical protein
MFSEVKTTAVESGLEIVFAEMKDRLRDQEQSITNLSENARFVLTAASLLVASFSGLLGVVIGAPVQTRRVASNCGPPLRH